jgi:hypothetical protein
MGNLFCSYFVENKISRMRSAIKNAELNEIKAQVKSNSTHILPSLRSLIDAEIDTEGNTPLLFSIETRQLNSFRFIVAEFQPNLNQGNYLTEFKPLHVCALTKVEGKTSFRVGDSIKKYGTLTNLGRLI